MNIDNVSNRLLVAKAGGDATDNPSPDLVTLLNQLRTGTIKIAQGDITSNRPTDPLLYEIYFDSTLGYFVYCSAPRNGSTPAVWAPLVAAPQRNYLVDGGSVVAQGAPANLSSVPVGTYLYGPVDAWKCAVIAGVGVGGSLSQRVGTAPGRTGFAVQISGLSGGTGGQIRFRTFVESKTALNLKNVAASFACSIGSNVTPGFPIFTAQITVSRANAPDNFAAVTTIAQSPILNVPALALGPAAFNPFSLSNFNMGDTTNGVCVDVDYFYGGNLTGRTVILSEAVLCEGPVAVPFPYEDFDAVLQRCQRYYQKSFGYAVAPAQNVGTAASLGGAAYRVIATGVVGSVPVRFAVPMRAAPTMIYFNPAAANANWRNTGANTDSGPGINENFSVGEGGFTALNVQVGGDTVGAPLLINWTADARF